MQSVARCCWLQYQHRGVAVDDSFATRAVAVGEGLFSGLCGGLEGSSLSLATISSSMADINVLSSQLAPGTFLHTMTNTCNTCNTQHCNTCNTCNTQHCNTYNTYNTCNTQQCNTCMQYMQHMQHMQHCNTHCCNTATLQHTHVTHATHAALQHCKTSHTTLQCVYMHPN